MPRRLEQKKAERDAKNRAGWNYQVWLGWNNWAIGIKDKDVEQEMEVKGQARGAQVQDAPEPVKKPAPTARAAQCQPLDFAYLPAPGEIDSNLVILLHGLGDTENPFASLGARLQRNLPQTAILSVRGGHAVPFMDNAAWGYWDVWDELGQEISSPNLTSFLQSFSALLDHLVKPLSNGGCGWPPSSLHLFGFAHGATAAMEGAIAWTRRHRGKEADNSHHQLGSIVGICGGLLSHPTFTLRIATPVLAFERGTGAPQASTHTLSRAFAHVTVASFASRPDPITGTAQEPAIAMPSTEQEWEAIMRFWARFLRNRSSWELRGEMVSVS